MADKTVIKYSVPLPKNTLLNKGRNIGRKMGYRHFMIVYGMFVLGEELQDFIDSAIDDPAFVLVGDPQLSEVGGETNIWNIKVIGNGFGTAPIDAEVTGTGKWVYPNFDASLQPPTG